MRTTRRRICGETAVPTLNPDYNPALDELASRGEAGPEFIAASLGSGTVIEVKARHTLFPVADMVTATPHRNWDVSPDGRSFAMVRFNPATRIMVIQQLPALVARLQGAAR